jgi:polyhydroxyalkanoate synthase
MVNAEVTFVAGASGHIAGVINPPSANSRSYSSQENTKLPATYEEWLSNTTEHEGSWWPFWLTWLEQHAGKQVSAPKQLGCTGYPPMNDAPGSYVLERR